MTGIAVIGMAGRFPGADSVEALWRMLLSAQEGLEDVSTVEQLAAGVPHGVRSDPSYVARGGFIRDADRFDAKLFGYSVGEAERLDPQHRIFLECGWAALEAAGYGGPGRPRTGVYASAATSAHVARLLDLSGCLAGPEGIEALLAADKDFVAARLAYALNLTGPAVMIQTACSSSLVAVHFACQGLLGGDCDLAVAGGVTVRATQRTGYRTAPGFIFSPRGTCRPFHPASEGSVPADGVALLVLSRLEDACANGDTVHAVIKATAINNDGSKRAGFTAPSVAGQTGVVQTALMVAGVPAETIGYLEAHGTGTALGDRIELAGIAECFAGTPPEPVRWIGSIKGNIGHLDAAAGASGLIKAVLAVREGVVPPSLGFETPVADSAFAHLPFRVPTTAQPWPPIAGPRRAGISSFGLGGTNAHVIIEALAEQPYPQRAARAQLLTWSANTPAALSASGRALADRFGEPGAPHPADAARTLAVGRANLPFRAYAVAAKAATARESVLHATERAAETAPALATLRVAFLFAGIGDATGAAAEALAAVDDEIASLMARAEACLDAETISALRRELGRRPRASLQRGQPLCGETAAWQAHPALFFLEYALARFWIAAGIEPTFLLGHSLGELTAAAVAEVIEFEEALKITIERARAIERLAPGAMIAVSASADELKPLLPPGLDLAAANSPVSCTVAGSMDALRAWSEGLSAHGIVFRPIANGSLLHTRAAAAALTPVRTLFERATLKAPRYPIISARTAARVSDEQARDPNYWAEQITTQVRFEEAVRALAGQSDLLLEIGPAQTLSAFVAQTLTDEGRGRTIASFESPITGGNAVEQLLAAAGWLWTKGAPLRRERLCVSSTRRVPLPTYPFEGPRFAQPSLIAPASGRETAEQYKQSVARGVAPFAQQSVTDDATTEVQDILAEMWRDILKVSEIRKNDSFRALGGDSLMALRLVAAIRHAFDIDVKMVELWARPTLQEQAKFVLGQVVSTIVVPDKPRSGSECFAVELGGDLSLAVLGPDLDRAAYSLIRSAFPWLTDGADGDFETLAATNGISLTWRRFVRHWRELLSRAALCAIDEDPTAPLKALHERTLGTPYAALVAAVEAVGTALRDLVSDRLSGAEILLAPADASPAEWLYRWLPESRTAIDYLGELVGAVLAASEGQTLRCIEIGGGFGVATDALLSRLCARPHNYMFTDASAYFLERMRARQKALDFAIFDIDHAPPLAVGLDSFDVAIAANVLHCARHVRDALMHVRATLRPGGYLLLLETTAAADWHGLSMGVLQGFLSFEDDRVATPFLSVDGWTTRLAETGFGLVSVLPAAGDGDILGQHAILAQRTSL